MKDVEGGVQMVLDFTFELEGSAKPARVARAIFRRYARAEIGRPGAPRSVTMADMSNGVCARDARG